MTLTKSRDVRRDSARRRIALLSRARFVRILILLFGLATPARADSVPSVIQFSPQGTVKNVRQVSARFSQPMVPLGQPFGGLNPFDIDCNEKGSARWLDATHWVFDFAGDLPAGVQCTFKLRGDLKTLAGVALAGQRSFSFSTGGPAILESMPWQGSDSIDEQQAFLLILDAKPDIASVIQNSGFSVEGIPERVGARMLTDAEAAPLLKHFAGTIEKRPVIILQAKQRFPNSAAVSLIWGKGIRTPSGPATTQDQVLNFKTRKPFEATFRCERENAHAACIPLTPMSLYFSEPVSADLARRVTLTAPDGSPIASKPVTESEVNEVSFPGPFKESTQFKLGIPPEVIDDSGRALSNASRFPMTVATDKFPPLAKFSARFGIIEAADPVLPVTVRNLEQLIHASQLQVQGETTGLLSRIEATLWRLPQPDAKSSLQWMRKVARARRAASVFSAGEVSGVREFTMPKPNGADAFEVMGIPLKHPGLYIVELKSQRLGSVLLGVDQPMYVPTAALVTNLAVHFKKGNANSLVWVTALESAAPVADAEVSIADCAGNELWHGITDARGLAMVPKLASMDPPAKCANLPEDNPDPDSFSDQVQPIRELDSGVLVTAHKGDDFSFVHSSWQQGIEAWRFHLPTDYQPSPLAADTVFDRPLFRAGETVHMKHFIRRKSLDGFAFARAADLPNRISIKHSGGEEHYDFDIAWNANGTAESIWNIPKEAKLGEYEVTMTRRKKDAPAPPADGFEYDPSQLSTSTFRVEEFRIPLMHAAVKLPVTPQVAVTSIPVDLSAQYLSGGPAKGLPVTLRSQVSPGAGVSVPDLEGFAFANGAVKVGIEKHGDYSEAEETAEPNAGIHQRKDLVLDANGGVRTEISDLKTAPTPVEVRAEMEYRDPNGESQTVANGIVIWPAHRLPAIAADFWVSSKDKARVRVAVVDDSLKPVANAPVRVELFTRKRYEYRKRLVGGFYAYENTTDTERVGELCSGATDAHGLMFCDKKPAVTGEAFVQATVTDQDGKSASANSELFIPGSERFVFEGRDEDRIDVLPEKPQYEPGDTARFQVRMPFSTATALVTVEREGIIASSVIQLSGTDPVITLPVRDYAPNVFVSVLAVRGRVGGIQPTAMIDLGKPAFKLGIAQIRVGWRDHALKVTVTPEREAYHVREKARVKIAVKTASGAAPPAGTEVAIAAVDEGLLELKHNDSWKLLDAMMGQRSYQVETSAAETEVVGKRHFGLKAVPPGGGGGRQVTRELFDTLLLWKAALVLDANGEASVEIPLNDSLTSFRIAAIASGGVGMFGNGSALIRSTQDLMILSGISPIIRTGDSFAAEFTVRNASQAPLEVALKGNVEGLNQPLSENVKLAPGEGKAVSWNIAVPDSARDLKYRVDAVATTGPADHLAVTQRVLPTVAVRTYQATLVRLDQPFSEQVAAPLGSIAGLGAVEVALRPSLGASLEGVREWMLAYPYICLEQRVSRAVALHDAKMWNGIVASLPSYMDSDGLLKYFPIMILGSDVLTSYVLSIAHEAGLAIPAPIEQRMRDGLRGFVEGRVIRSSAIVTVDLPIRKLAALEALSRVEKIRPGELGSISIDPNLWPDSSVIDWWAILLRTAAIPDRDNRLATAEQIIRSRLNAQGTAMHLSSDPRSCLCWLMVSPASNMARLTLLLLENKLWSDDAPRVMNGAIGLQSRGNWGTTTANAWGTLAVEKFVAAFESKPVGGTTSAVLEAAHQALDWSKHGSGGNLDFAWPAAPANLHIEHSGSGTPWAEIRASAAVPTTKPITTGYQISKKIEPVDKSHAGQWRRGDLARVHLAIDAQTDSTWVVVNDPIPAGASQLGSGLERDSQIAVSGENHLHDELWPSFEERAFDSYRAYYEYVPKGHFEVVYTIRLNQAGKFEMPSTRVEAIYEPDMFGEIPNAEFAVAP